MDRATRPGNVDDILDLRVQTLFRRRQESNQKERNIDYMGRRVWQGARCIKNCRSLHRKRAAFTATTSISIAPFSTTDPFRRRDVGEHCGLQQC